MVRRLKGDKQRGKRERKWMKQTETEREKYFIEDKMWLWRPTTTELVWKQVSDFLNGFFCLRPTYSLTHSLGQIKPWLKPRAIKSLKIAHSWTPDKRGTSYKCSYLKFVLRMPFKVWPLVNYDFLLRLIHLTVATMGNNNSRVLLTW